MLCISLSIFTSCDGSGNHTHTYKTDWAKDATHHWHECEDTDCNEVSEKSAHSYENATTVDTTKHKKTCVCGAEITEAHSWDNGQPITESTPDAYGSMLFTCTGCGQTKNEFPTDLTTTMTIQEYSELVFPIMEEDGSVTLTVFDDIGTANQTKFTATIGVFGEKKMAVVDSYKYVNGSWIRDYANSCIRIDNGGFCKIYSPNADDGSYENCSITTDATTLYEFIESIMNNGFPGMAFMEWTYDETEKAYVNPEDESHKMYRRGSDLFVVRNNHRIDVTNIGTTALNLPEDFSTEYINNAKTTVTEEQWKTAFSEDTLVNVTIERHVAQSDASLEQVICSLKSTEEDIALDIFDSAIGDEYESRLYLEKSGAYGYLQQRGQDGTLNTEDAPISNLEQLAQAGFINVRGMGWFFVRYSDIFLPEFTNSFSSFTYDEESKMYVATNISSEGVYFDMGGVSAPLNYEYVKIAFEDGKLARIELKKANDYDCTILYKDYETTEIIEIFE
ncbi:MAG: hypothetical protein IKC34_02030 [Clostridia bacterium]|nr:hypothetical protein [Clostridia bacterium]